MKPIDLILTAKNYVELFGTVPNEAQIKKTYYRYAKIVHPDTNGGELASTAFVKLDGFYHKALLALEAGSYGQVYTEVKTKKHTYEVYDLIARGDIADIYVCKFEGHLAKLKIARSGTDNDMMQAEAMALKHLVPDKPEGDKFIHAIPSLVESFRYKKRRAAVLQEVIPGPYYTLEEVHSAYPDIDLRHMAWIFRRLLNILGYVHARGVVHGAVLPSHVLVQPDTHRVLLVDWCYATMTPEGSPDGLQGAPIKAISTKYKAWYPPSVFKKEAATSRTDICMAAQCMQYLIEDISFKWQSAQDKRYRRFEGFLLACQLPGEQDAWKLYDEFTNLIDSIWTRKFVPFQMPPK